MSHQRVPCLLRSSRRIRHRRPHHCSCPQLRQPLVALGQGVHRARVHWVRAQKYAHTTSRRFNGWRGRSISIRRSTCRSRPRHQRRRPWPQRSSRMRTRTPAAATDHAAWTPCVRLRRPQLQQHGPHCRLPSPHRRPVLGGFPERWQWLAGSVSWLQCRT